MPSSRRLPIDLGTPFNTVAQTCRDLKAEDWLELTRKRDTFVRAGDAGQPIIYKDPPMKPASLLKAAALTLFACALLAPGPAIFAKPYRGDWPHAASDLQPDPAVKYGRLPNGMRYAILKNNTPVDATSMRLVIDAGSVQERDAQQGVAHLVEHMAFRGSKHVPDGEVVKTLQRLGLRFGADTNASTSFSQTVYKFDLPHSDRRSIDDAMLLLREIASELNITDEALATERGVVLSEYRLNMATPQARSALKMITTVLPDQRVTRRFPIGKPEIVEKADAALVRSYYRAYYRPDRATLLVVGNVDVPKLEKKIVADFSNWKPSGPAGDDPELGAVTPHGLIAKAHFEQGLPTTVVLNWTAPYRNDPETSASLAASLITQLGVAIVNQRLQQAALGDDAAFTAAGLGWTDNFLRSAQLGTFSVVTTPQKWQVALQAARRILETALAQGVTQDEVDRMAANMLTGLQNQQKGAATQPSAAIIEHMVSALEGNKVFESPLQQLQQGEAILKGLSAEKITAALRQVYHGNPVAYVTSAAPLANAEADLGRLLAARAGDAGGKVTPTATAPGTWPYEHFGAPGKVVSQTRLDDLGITFVRFANHVVLAVKPNTFKKDEIQIVVKVNGGQLRVPTQVSGAQPMILSLVNSGLSAIDQPTIQKVLAGRTVTMFPQLGEAHLALHGKTTPRDLDTQLQLLTAYLTAPTLRSGAVEQLRQGLLAVLPQIESQPLRSLSRHAPYLLHDHDARWAFPSVDAVRAIKVEDLKAWLLPQLKQGPVEVNIMGDVSVERAVAAVASTFGAIATRPKPAIDIALGKGVKFPAGGAAPIVTRYHGSKDKAALMVAWPAPDRRSNQQESMDAQLLSVVLQNRLVNVIRGKFGAGYAPQSACDGAWFTPGYGFLMAITDAKPQQTQAIFAAIAAMSADLREKPIGKDELERARQPVLAGAARMMQSNNYGMLLVSPDIDPVPMEFLRTQIAMIKAVTPERLQRIARKYLVDDKAVRQVLLPE